MKAWQWFKALPIWKAAAIVGSALLFGLASAGVASRVGKAKALERRAEDNAASGATRALEKAVKQTEQAEKHKAKARQAKATAAARLDSIGASDETLAELVTDWNSGERLRPG